MPLCSHCGAEVAPGINAACRDCGLAPDLTTPATLPAPKGADRGDEEVVFDVSEWPATQRVAFGGALRRENVPWRWEPGPVLVVRTFDESVVEGLLEDADIDNDEWQDTTGMAAEEEADEQAQGAMSELFDAADRLVHSPTSGDIVDEVDGLAATIGEAPPPFGIEGEAWEHMATLAATVVSAGADGDDEAVEEAARRLRDYLRDFV